MNRKKRTRTAVAILSLIAGVGPLSPAGANSTPAHPAMELVPSFDDDLPRSGETYTAETVAGPPPFVCTVHASDPNKFANTIDGEGFQSCAGTGWSPHRLKVTIQRYRALGFWQNRDSVDSGDVFVDFVQRDLIYNSSGAGSQLYRVVSDGWAAGGAFHLAVQSENYLRVDC